MIFHWWDDAVAHATMLASETQIRHRVFAHRGVWAVAPVMVAVAR